MKRPPKKLLWLVALPIVGVIAYVAFAGFGSGKAADRYQVQAAEKGDLVQSVSANGTLNPVSVVNVGTQVSGTVRKLYVDYNSRVKKGQVLLELDDSLLAAQVKQSEANVASATADLELARANAARARELFAKEYVSRQEFDQSVQAEKSAVAKLALAHAQLEKDHANLNYSIIRSPVSGIVIDRSVDVGQTVAASFQTPTLVKIAEDLSKMQIDSNFAEADIGRIREGQSVRFNVDAFPNRAFQGTVKRIRLNPTTQQNVVTYDVVVAVDNPEQILLPGMTAYVNLVVAERKDALMVPNAALRFAPAELKNEKRENAPKEGGMRAGHKRDANSGRVFVLDNGQLRPAMVTLGITDNRNTEVVGGELKPGEQVVIGDKQEAPKADAAPGGMRVRMF